MPRPAAGSALRLLLPALLLWAGAPAAMAQGENGFLRGRGKLDLAFSYSVDRCADYSFENGGPTDIDDVERRTSSLHAAYGVTGDFDLVLSAAHVEASSESGSGFDDESGLQDASVRAKWRFHRGECGPGQLALLFAPGVRLPVDDYTDFGDNALSGLGEGDTSLLARFIVHYEWSTWFASLESGYDHRTGDLDDEIPVNFALGTSIGSRWFVQGFFSTLVPLGDTVSNPLYSDDQDPFRRVGLSAYLRVTDQFGLSASFRISDEGDNDSQGASLGVVLRF